MESWTGGTSCMPCACMARAISAPPHQMPATLRAAVQASCMRRMASACNGVLVARSRPQPQRYADVARAYEQPVDLRHGGNLPDGVKPGLRFDHGQRTTRVMRSHNVLMFGGMHR
jgi:hypothetical protein